MENVEDCRQEKEVKHKINDIILLVFMANLANANEWVEIEIFGKEHELFLRLYMELPNGIPSHDTIQQVFVDEHGFCVGKKLAAKKSNEITAIPELLDTLNIKEQIIKIDVMGKGNSENNLKKVG